MELTPLDHIQLDEVTQSLFRDLEETARQVNEFRPLSPTVVKRVQDELLGERVYSSNAIEGSTLDLRETVMILRTGQIDVAKRREATEALNLGTAIEITQSFDPSQLVSLDRFLDVHRILLTDIQDDWAGRLRDQRVMVRGAKHQPPHDREIRTLLDEMFTSLAMSEKFTCPLVATWCHWAIARIHPFFDGNGRMARLWQDLILLNGRMTCAVIRPQDRKEYLRSLESADDGDFNLLCQMVAQRIVATFDKYLSAQQEEEALGAWANELADETESRVAEERRLAYLRWSRKMEELRYAFEHCAALISHRTSHTEIQVRRYELIDQSAWELVRSGAPASRTWFFSVTFRRDTRSLTYYFFFGKHFWSDLDSEKERGEPRACLLISKRAGPNSREAVRLDEMPDAIPTVREIFVADNAFVRKRMDVTTSENVYDRDVSAMQLAKDFIGEVMLHRLTTQRGGQSS